MATMKICIGGFPGACSNLATNSKWSELWCDPCDEKRIAHLNSRFKELEKLLDNRKDGADE